MIEISFPRNDDAPDRGAICRAIDDHLDAVSAKGWILVGTQVIKHAGKGWLRVLVATFRRGKPRSAG